MKTSFVVVLCLLAGSSAALADEAPSPKNAVSLRPLAFLADGVSVQYERFTAPPWWSIAGGPAIRSGAGGDYSSLTLAFGAEARVWLNSRLSVIDSFSGPAMSGPYVSGRLELAWLEVTDEQQDRSVGSMLTFSESFWFGWRFTFFRHLEVSLSMGTALRHEIDPDGRLASYTRWAPVAFGTTVGWMF